MVIVQNTRDIAFRGFARAEMTYGIMVWYAAFLEVSAVEKNTLHII